MDFELNASELKFRDEVRGWLKANQPADDRRIDVAEKEFIEVRQGHIRKPGKPSYEYKANA